MIAYSSKALTKEQRRYCITRKEFLAIYSHLKYFKNYLWGRMPLVRTDHGALQWYKNFTNPDDQLASWIETVEESSATIVTRPGNKHDNADALSRIPTCTGKKCVCSGFCKQPVLKDAYTSTSGLDSNASLDKTVRAVELVNEFKLEDVIESQKSDPDISPIFELKEQQKPQPDWNSVSHFSSETKAYWAEWDRIVLRNGALYRKWEKEDGSFLHFQLIQPKGYRLKAMKLVHGTGHFGRPRTYLALRQRFYWFRMKSESERWVRTCDVCQKCKKPARYNRAMLQSYVVGSPMERIGIDVLGPLPISDRGHTVILVIGDYFT